MWWWEERGEEETDDVDGDDVAVHSRVEYERNCEGVDGGVVVAAVEEIAGRRRG
jgi:hypothetical protein